MKRTLLFLFGGMILGGIIHLVVILILPQFAERDIWSRVEAIGAVEDMVLLDTIVPGADNPLRLDPAMIYGICQLSLNAGPAVVNGTLPLAFWSVGVFNDQGHVVYSTTSRSHAGATIDMGIFSPAQTRMLTEQPIEIEEGLMIVEANSDDIFVVMRLAPPHEAVRARYREALGAMRCVNIR